MKYYQDRPIPENIRAVATAAWDVFGPNAMVSGGVLRDLVFGFPERTKDIDIVVPVYSDNQAVTDIDLIYREFCVRRGWDRGRLCLTSTYRTGDMAEVVAYVVEVIPPGSIPVQFIGIWRHDSDVSFTDLILGRNDFGACQIALEGFRLVWSQAAERDFYQKRMTLMKRADGRYDRSLRRADRFRERFPELEIDTSVADAGSY